MSTAQTEGLKNFSLEDLMTPNLCLITCFHWSLVCAMAKTEEQKETLLVMHYVSAAIGFGLRLRL